MCSNDLYGADFVTNLNRTADYIRTPDRGDRGERDPWGSKRAYIGVQGPHRSERARGGKSHGGEETTEAKGSDWDIWGLTDEACAGDEVVSDS